MFGMPILYVAPEADEKSISPRNLLNASFEIESIGDEFNLYDDENYF